MRSFWEKKKIFDLPILWELIIDSLESPNLRDADGAVFVQAHDRAHASTATVELRLAQTWPGIPATTF